jgi:aminoglycoside phosphotransferase (APT) family kinase protein
MTSSERVSTMVILADLLENAGLPAAETTRQLSERGFDHEVHLAQLYDGRYVVLRRRKKRGEPEQVKATFLESHGAPAPRLLAGTGDATLHEFIPGTLLGDLIETRLDTQETWRMVGQALRRVHDVRFPCELVGEVQPNQIVLRPVDPLAAMHAQIEESIPGLRRLAPTTLEHLPALHDVVNRSATSLRTAPTSLLHGDISMWNIIVNDNEAVLIDWDVPRVGESAMEVALLDIHASLFNGRGLDNAFYSGYGRGPAEPNTSLHRVVQTLFWAASDDWTSFEKLPAESYERTRRWLTVLLAHVGQLATHIQQLYTLV